MNLSACLEREEMYGTTKENKTDTEKPEEGKKMALTSSDLQAIQGLLQPINERLDGVDSRLDGIDSRLDRVESEVSALKSGQLEMRKELKEVNRKVSVTYELALDAWGTNMENRGWLERESGFSSKVFGDGKNK